MQFVASKSRDINETGRFSNGESTQRCPPASATRTMRDYGFADRRTILALPRCVRRANRGLVERRNEIQHDVPKAVAQDDAPEVARLEDGDPVEQSDREHEDEVHPVEEEDVQGREDRGHVKKPAAWAEALHRAFQQDRAEDEFVGEARREEDHEGWEDDGAERQPTDPSR